MFSTWIRGKAWAAGSVAAVLASAGCASARPAGNSGVTDASSQSQMQMAMSNQGRFPAPTYTQAQQAAPYALTGERASAGDYQWMGDTGRRITVGNAVVFVPPSR